jgi:hypothetical protein
LRLLFPIENVEVVIEALTNEFGVPYNGIGRSPQDLKKSPRISIGPSAATSIIGAVGQNRWPNHYRRQ